MYIYIYMYVYIYMRVFVSIWSHLGGLEGAAVLGEHLHLLADEHLAQRLRRRKGRTQSWHLQDIQRNRLKWPHRRQGLASDGVRYAGARSSVGRRFRSATKLRLEWYGGVFVSLQQRSKHPREIVITPKDPTSHFEAVVHGSIWYCFPTLFLVGHSTTHAIYCPLPRSAFHALCTVQYW